ncbi:MAG: UDP-hydrolyzing UDP-N-acetyl-D-glucosamine 2-epimerase [Cyclobacteriaceae bacterium]|jgi:UDP-hydrolysing UDP-N-acetyl-D-glucosamine 2-epimerase
MEIKKVCVVITARASYSRIRSALHAINKHADLELQLVVAASALIDRYGGAVEIMEKDGFEIKAKVHNVVESSSLIGQAKTAGLGIIELSNVFDSIKPDCVVTIADRYETISTAISAAYMNIPLVHIQGGEVTGNIDEKVRHAITKLADLHLVSTPKSKERVIKMGENPYSVFISGCPSIDIAKQVLNEEKSLFDIYAKYGGVGNIPNYEDGYIVVMQHPVTTEYQEAKYQIEQTLSAVTQVGLPAFWFWPNVDGGGDGTSKGIRIFREQNPNGKIHFFRNMEPEDFLRLLKHSKCIVGNSSVGIRECSYLGVPSVNIGSRQSGREKGDNVIEVDYDSEQIIQAINRQLENGSYAPDELYGNGDAGFEIAKIIAVTDIKSNKILQY